MDIKKGLTYLQEHPMVLALLIFVGLFLYFQVIKKSSTSTATSTTLAPGEYIDPVTGAVTRTPTSSEQYIQQYNSYPTGGTVIQQSGTPGTVGPKGPPGPTGPPGPKGPPAPKPKPTPAPKPPVKVAHYITVTRWPSQNGTLTGIAQSGGISLAQVEAMNPQYKSNWNLIQPGQQVRIS
jgi:hypothetical protein